MVNNLVRKLGYSNIAGLLLIAIAAIMATSIVSVGQIGGSAGNSGVNSSVMATICNIFNTIKNVIFILGLALMVLGGAIYAGANLMPSASRGAFQGYGMAMVIGGVIGVAIAVAAPFILNTVVGASGAGGQLLTSGISTTGGGVTGSSAAQTAVSACAQYTGGLS